MRHCFRFAAASSLLAALGGCPTDSLESGVSGLLGTVAGTSTSNPPAAEPANPGSATAAQLRDDATTLSGRVASRAEFKLFELGPGAAGDEWTLTNDTRPPTAVLVTVVFLDAEFDLLSRAIVGPNSPMRYVARRSTEKVYVGVSAAYSSSAGDFALTARRRVASELPPVSPQRVYLNFNGAANVSVHGRAAISFGAFDAAVISADYAGRNAAVKGAVAAVMRADYAPFNVEITTSDEGPPPAGPYSTVHFGGYDPGLLGLADSVDEYNADPAQNAIIYVENFADFAIMRLSPEEMGVMLGNVGSHELGHLLGLYHTRDPADIMDTTGSAWDLAGVQEFLRAPLETSVFPTGTGNAPSRLEESVGRKPDFDPATVPPKPASKVRDRASLERYFHGELHNRCGLCEEFEQQ